MLSHCFYCLHISGLCTDPGLENMWLNYTILSFKRSVIHTHSQKIQSVDIFSVTSFICAILLYRGVYICFCSEDKEKSPRKKCSAGKTPLKITFEIKVSEAIKQSKKYDGKHQYLIVNKNEAKRIWSIWMELIVPHVVTHTEFNKNSNLYFTIFW